MIFLEVLIDFFLDYWIFWILAKFNFFLWRWFLTEFYVFCHRTRCSTSFISALVTPDYWISWESTRKCSARHEWPKISINFSRTTTIQSTRANRRKRVGLSFWPFIVVAQVKDSTFRTTTLVLSLRWAFLIRMSRMFKYLGTLLLYFHFIGVYLFNFKNLNILIFKLVFS